MNLPTRPWPSRRLRSLPAVLGLLLLAGFAFTLVAAVAGSFAGSASTTLTHQLLPLRDAGRAIEGGMAAMDNAVRAANAAGTQSAPAQYSEASRQVADAQAAASNPAKRLGGGLPAALARVRDAVSAWQRAAGDPASAGLRAGAGGSPANGQADALFDGYRTAMTSFAAALDAREASLRDAAGTASTLRTVAAFAAGASLLLAALTLIGWYVSALPRRRRRGAAAGPRLDGRRLLDALPDAVVVIDPESMRLRNVNAAAERLSGQDREVLLSLPPVEPGAADRERGLAGAVAAALAAARNDRSYRYTWLQPSGARVPLEGLNGVLAAGGRQLLVAVLRDLRGRLESERELGDSRDQLEAIIQGVADGILMQDPAGVVTYANETAARILGYAATTALIGRTIDRPASHFEVLDERGEPLPAERLPVRRVLGGEPEVEALLHYRRRGGAGERWVVFRSSAVRSDDGQARFVLSVLHDLTALMRAQEELRRSRDQLNAILQGVADGITVLDPGGRVIYANDAAARLFGFGSAEGLPRGREADPWRSFELTDESGLPVLRESLPDRRAAQGKEAVETLVCARPRGGGDERWLLLKSTAIRDDDDRVQFAVNVLTDVTERRRAEQLERQALTDSLTGLPNRRLVDDRLQQAIFVAQRNRGSLALLFIDLDRFKAVNDRYGHATGDQLLQEVGGRLQESLRQTDTVARLGGDEFTAILPGARPPGASAAAEKILKSLERPFQIDGQPLTIGASIGIAFYPDDAEDAATLTRHADLAMYAAKRSGSGHAIYSPELDGQAPLETDLSCISA